MNNLHKGYQPTMEQDKGRPTVGNWFATAAIALAIGLLVVLVLLFTGALLDAPDDLVTVLLAGVAGVAVVGWWQDKLARAERDRAEATKRRQEESEREEQERERDQRDKEREQQERAQQEKYMHELKWRVRLERAHNAERQWARELREQVSRLHREQGALGHSGDVRELVLQTAVRLVEADRGLLLSREDQDGDGDFDMVCSIGFQNDPAHSAVAQEYAGKVLRHDETVREDDSSELHGDGRNEADEEIHNLLAIPIYIQDQFSGVVLCANREAGFDDLDDDVLLALGDHAGAVLENGRLHGELRTSYVSTVRMLAEAIEAKDPSTRLHSEEVADYVGAVADQLDIEPRRREELLIGSLLHDVGKIGISERILLKPGPLTPEERDAIELHPGIGFRLVRQVPALEGIAPAVLHHHERYDGNGYPEGLAGEGIPLEARV
ncbi:MAG: HD-GYP domain-containing protein, partial [Thermoleophilaceae bacterium]